MARWFRELLPTGDFCEAAEPSEIDTTVALPGGKSGSSTLAIPASLGNNFPVDADDAVSEVGRFTRTTG